MSLTRICLLLSLLGFLGAANSCNTTPPEYRRLFGLSVERQAEEFQKYSPEQQVEIYLYAVQRVEPPATQFGDFLAANGRRVLPALLAKLREERNDRLKFYLVDVLYKMHRERCSLRDDTEVIGTVKVVISTIKDGTWRNFCETSLKTILEQPGLNNKPC